MRYRFLYGASIGQVASGGRIDASSNGVWLESENELKRRRPLELLIDWPAQLNGMSRCNSSPPAASSA